MELLRWHVKLLCMGAIFILQVIFILLPLKLTPYIRSKGKKGRLVLSALSCFGGGVFFGAFLMHLLPEVRILMEDAFLRERNITFPVTEAIAGFGFFFILFIEKLVMRAQSKSAKKVEAAEEKSKEAENNEDDITMIKYDLYSNGMTSQEGHNAVGRLFPVGEGPQVDVVVNGKKPEVPSSPLVAGCGCSVGLQALKDTTDLETVEGGHKTPNASPSPLTVGCGCSVGRQALSNTSELEKVEGGHNKDIAAGIASSAIFILALSMDSFFEGLSLGLKLRSSEVVALFVAIISHEFIMSFCIGLELYKYFPKRKHVIIGIFYGLTPNIGAAIGTAIVETAGYGGNKTVDTVNGFLQAICVGTFIYCTFISILSEELTHENGLVKSLATAIGFAFMAGMAAVPDGSTVQQEVTTMMPNITDMM